MIELKLPTTFVQVFNKYIVLFETVLLCALFLGAVYINNSNHPDHDALTEAGSDIRFEYIQATELVKKGINPYEKIESGNLLINDKYATLFPLYYIFLGLVIRFSNFSFEQFVVNYWALIQLFEFMGFMSIYLIFRRSNKKALGLLAASFFIYNRWTINNLMVLKQDIISVSILLAALYYLPLKSKLSVFLYGISIGIKHIGIFASPVFILYLWTSRKSFKDLALSAGIFLTPILLPSIPFLVLNAKAFIYSIIFSVTRKPASSCGNQLTGFERVLVDYRNLGNSIAMFYLLLPRVPLAIFSGVNMLMLFAKKMPPQVYLPLAYFIFIALNPVYFDQYFLWVTPFMFMPLLAKTDISK